MTPTINNIPEFEIRLKTKGNIDEYMTVKGSEDIADIARQCFNADTIGWTESFICIALNRANKVLGFYKISQGGVSSTVCDPKVIFQFALLANASNIIIAHNHPSGNLKPSGADDTMTLKIKEAGKILDIKVLDHVIVTETGYYSYCENGQMY